jgi:hypothetical protein
MNGKYKITVFLCALVLLLASGCEEVKLFWHPEGPFEEAGEAISITVTGIPESVVKNYWGYPTEYPVWGSLTIRFNLGDVASSQDVLVTGSSVTFMIYNNNGESFNNSGVYSVRGEYYASFGSGYIDIGQRTIVNGNNIIPFSALGLY